MFIPTRLSAYLQAHDVSYDICHHRHSLVDSELEARDVVYLECGDHERLLKLAQAQFQALMRPARHGQFSDLRIH